jgi:hypothetical protein
MKAMCRTTLWPCRTHVAHFSCKVRTSEYNPVKRGGALMGKRLPRKGFNSANAKASDGSSFRGPVPSVLRVLLCQGIQEEHAHRPPDQRTPRLGERPCIWKQEVQAQEIGPEKGEKYDGR